MQAMRCIAQTFRRPPTGRIRDRDGGLPRLSDGVAHASRCPRIATAHAPSGLHQLKCTHTIAFPVSSAGGEAPAMRGHRQAFPTPRGDGKSDPKGGVARPPDVVARRL